MGLRLMILSLAVVFTVGAFTLYAAAHPAKPPPPDSEALCGTPSARELVQSPFARFWMQLQGVALTARNSSRGPDVRIVINLYEKRLYFYRQGKLVKSYPVAIGKEETPSPVGNYRVVHKDKDWGDGFGPRWMGLNVPWGIYGIHGTNKPWSIGTEASGGCFRMYNEDVIELWDQVPLGTPVDIVGPEPKDPMRIHYRPGMFGQDVVRLQLRLQAMGFPIRVVDGRYSSETEEAVKKAQAFFGLQPTGQAEEDLLWLLGFREAKVR
ncbi:MAG: L,D-transpeptidase family protein [Clostridiales bacterium]|nr:L,D-transpeptidase family protein [Clostridiales bacterium]